MVGYTVLAGLALLSVECTAIDYQKVGQCGVPATGYNTQLFLHRKKRGIFDALPDTTESPTTAHESTQEDPTGRIVGGTIAKTNSWPWQSHLSVCGKWYGIMECNICGGSLIHPKWIMSAAHCVPESPSGTVILGADNIHNGGTQRIAVHQFHVHPGWNKASMFDSDMSLVELVEGAKVNQQVSPICLPHSSTCFAADTQCVVTGWGLTDERGGFPERLQEVAVRLMNPSLCKQWKGYEGLSNNMICAGYEEGGRDACAGDSGGPLVCRLPSGAWVLYGVVSWGYGCARPNSPGVYSRVATLLDFVKSTTGLSPDDNIKYTGTSTNGVTAANDESAIEGMPCMGINDEDAFNQQWLDTYKSNVEELDYDVEAPKEQVTIQCNYRETTQPMLTQGIITKEINAGGGRIYSEKFGKVKRGGTAYPTNVDCVYRVENTGEDEFVKVMVKGGSVINCKGSDQLLIHPDGARKYKMCRVRRNVNFQSNTGISIQFKTDNAADRLHPARAKGFEIQYAFMNKNFMCSGPSSINLQGTSKNAARTIIKSENFPKYYSRSSQCRWNIETSPGFKICYDIKVFRTERSRRCNRYNDVMVIFEADDCDSSTLQDSSIYGTLCGLKKPTVNNQVFAEKTCWVFVADNDTRRNRGFLLSLFQHPRDVPCERNVSFAS